MSNTYTLEATYQGRVYRHRMEVRPSHTGWPATLDDCAVVDASFQIIDLAYQGRGNRALPWQRGAIRLLTPDGRVLKEMPGKDQ